MGVVAEEESSRGFVTAKEGEGRGRSVKINKSLVFYNELINTKDVVPINVHVSDLLFNRFLGLGSAKIKVYNL